MSQGVGCENLFGQFACDVAGIIVAEQPSNYSTVARSQPEA